MLRLLKFLWAGTWHICDYSVPYKTVDVYEADYYNMPSKTLEVCRCKKCGNIKSFKV